MAVQGKNDAMICDRCFATVKHGSEFCPECGAPMGEGPAEGSDAAIYPDLARANLLRMRGDYKAALQHCRTILHKFPNNVTANQLLGDLCLEIGDMPQAKEWYELALDIAPNHTQIQKKLNDVRQKLEQQETEGLVEQLGLPPSKPKNGLIAVALSILVIGIAIVAYILGTKKPSTEVAGTPTKTEIKAPVVTPPDNTGATATTGVETPTNPAPNTSTTPPSTQGSTEDSSLFSLVAQKSANGSKLIGLVVDPRTSLLTLTYRVESTDDKRLVGAELAATALDNSSTTRLITLRAVENGALAYLADVRREAYEETKTDAWRQANGTELSAIAKHILSQEWPASTEPPASQDPALNNPGP